MIAPSEKRLPFQEEVVEVRVGLDSHFLGILTSV